MSTTVKNLNNLLELPGLTSLVMNYSASCINVDKNTT